ALPILQVTSEAIEVVGEVYRFDERSRIWHRRDQRSWKALAGRGMWGLSYFSPILAAIFGLVVAFTVDLSLGTRVMIVVASILVGLSAGPLIDRILGKLDDPFVRGVHGYEIWVERDGVEIRLL